MRKPWQTKEWKDKRKTILKTRNKCEWCGSLEYLTIDHVCKYKSYDDYMKLEGKDFLILCRKCAYARKMGLIICVKCKKHYHHLMFSSCKQCSPLFIEYELPCNNFVSLLKEDVESELFSPMDACMHHCENSEIGGDVNNCDDFKDWWD